MANKHLGTVALKAGDEDYTVSFSVNALCEMEEAMDLPIAKLAAVMQDRENLRIKTVRQVVWAGLLDHHDVSLDQAGLIVSAAGIGPCMTAVGQALSLAFPAEEKKGPNPRKAAKTGS